MDVPKYIAKDDLADRGQGFLNDFAHKELILLNCLTLALVRRDLYQFRK